MGTGGAAFMNRQLYILGAGGLAKELGAYIKYINSEYLLKGFYDDNKSGKIGDLAKIHGAISEIVKLDGHTNLVIGVGDPGTKKNLFERIMNPDRYRFPSFVMPGAYLADKQSIEFGKGTFICAGSSLTSDIRIGDFCLLNLNCTVGHDVSMGDFSSIMPGVNISGKVTIGDGVMVGAGATVLQGLSVGDGAIVGAGAIVTKDVPPDTTVKGIAAE